MHGHNTDSSLHLLQLAIKFVLPGLGLILLVDAIVDVTLASLD